MECMDIAQDWKEFIDQILNLKEEDSYIFRGQSNFFDWKTKRFSKWSIISSFDR